MQFSTLSSSKMGISETDFFDILIIQNNEICYVKHVSALFYVFFTLFGCWGLGWGPNNFRKFPHFCTIFGNFCNL